MTVIDIEIAVMDRLDTATFEELAGFVQQSVGAAEQHARKSIHHLIEAGGALCAMRDRMSGQYQTWIAEVGLNRSWATQCQRLYTYRDELPKAAFSEWADEAGRTRQPSLSNAIKTISHLPSITNDGRTIPRKVTPEQRTLAERLLKDRVPRREIARILGVSIATVDNMTLTATELKERRRRSGAQRRAKLAAERALRLQTERDERDRLARTSGKELSVAYANVRQALVAFDKAASGVADRPLAQRTLAYLSAAESCIVAAMRAERAAA